MAVNPSKKSKDLEEVFEEAVNNAKKANSYCSQTKTRFENIETTLLNMKKRLIKIIGENHNG